MTRPLYLFREALVNMWRNPMVVAGAVLAVFVSLTLALGAVVLGEIVRVNTVQWQDGDHVIVFLKGSADGITLESHIGLENEIADWDVVESTRYVDQTGAYEEFQEIFANSPALIREVDPASLPASIRIQLSDISRWRDVQLRLIDKPAVRSVTAQGTILEGISGLTTGLNVGALLLAVIQAAAAVVLIANTVRMAIYARRDEVGIMKLVGAGNWFIRIPFFIEGLLEGLLGAGLAVVTVALIRPWLAEAGSAVDLIQLDVADGFFWRRAAILILFGGLAGLAGSTLGLRRFLKV